MTKRLFHRLGACLFLLVFCLSLFPAAHAEEVIDGQKIVYGYSGEGRELCAYRYGSGENVLIMGFAIHGYEDNFNQDGLALVETAQAVMKYLSGNLICDGHDFSVYILPCMNPDGLYSGYTNNGPGRCTTTYLDAEGNLITGGGIDLNRCFPTGFQAQYSSRNYTTSRPMAALEAVALDAFLQEVKGTGKNYLVDVHGWYQQTITSSATLKQVFRTHFPNNSQTPGGGPGYLVSHAGSLGYEHCLLELPRNIYSMSAYRSSGVIQEVVDSVKDLILTGPQACGGEHTYGNVETAPTCTTDGSSKYICTLCGEGEITVIPATGHSPDDTKRTTTPATATKDGSITAPCRICGGTAVVKTLDRVFTDTKSDQYYSDALDYCYAQEIVSGTGKTTFSPNNACTRAQIVTFLWRSMGQPGHSDMKNPFTDVSESAYYYDAVLWACENGITRGMTESSFAPNRTCNRGEAVTFLWRAQGSPDPGQVSHSFTDVKVGSYYEQAMLWAYQNGVTAGTSQTTFSPGNACIRAQIVTFLYRTLTLQ